MAILVDVLYHLHTINEPSVSSESRPPADEGTTSYLRLWSLLLLEQDGDLGLEGTELGHTDLRTRIEWRQEPRREAHYRSHAMTHTSTHGLTRNVRIHHVPVCANLKLHLITLLDPADDDEEEDEYDDDDDHHQHHREEESSVRVLLRQQMVATAQMDRRDAMVSVPHVQSLLYLIMMRN